MGLIAASDKIEVTPNFAPEWVSQPTPSFIASTTASYDLSVNTFDANGDTLVYAVSSGSTALSSAFTLTSAGLLQADGTQAAGNITGVIFDVSDGVAAPVASNAFTIAVVVQSNSAPSLFEDYGANALNGEAGAVSLNGDWPSTVYDYNPTYAPTVTPPTPTGDPAKPGTSQVNPNAADEYLVINSAGLTAAINNATYTKIFIHKGTDIHGLSTISASAGGTSANDVRWVAWWDASSPTAVSSAMPWVMATADRVYLPRIDWNGVDWLNIVGCAWGRATASADGFNTVLGRVTSCTNMIWYRCYLEHLPSSSNNGITFLSGGSSSNTFFECHFKGTGVRTSSDTHLINNIGCDNLKVVSSELHDANQGQPIQFSDQGTFGGVVEDCDIYKSVFYDGSGNEDPAGNFSRAEGSIGIKEVNSSAGTAPLRIWGNRFWGNNPPDPNTDITPGGSGSVIEFSSTTAEQWKHWFIDFRWNIFVDCKTRAFSMAPRAEFGGGNHSIVRNIVYNVGTSASDTYMHMYDPNDNDEIYLNTFKDCPSNFKNSWFRQAAPTTCDDQDWLGNVWINCPGAFGTQSNVGSSATVGYNVYTPTGTPTFNKTYGNDVTYSSAGALNMGDFTFKRKKLSGVENYTIPGIVPTSSTPSGFFLVPFTSSSADQVGSRIGLGVDDTF